MKSALISFGPQEPSLTSVSRAHLRVTPTLPSMSDISKPAQQSSQGGERNDAGARARVEDVPRPRKTRAFYMSVLAIMVASFLSALDLTAVGTALPTIAAALKDTKGEFTWVGAAYALSSTAFIPLSGSLADAFGRRPILLTSIAFFGIGSALSGAAQNMAGIGGGGILNLTEVLIADLVPLAERGLYQGLVGLAWSLASCIGPPIGVLNLPLTGVTFALVAVFLRVRTPPGSVKEKLGKVDWIGNALAIFGSGLVIIGLAWGGIRYPWASAPVLTTLILGMLFLGTFAVYEATVPTRPTIPIDVISNRTSLSGLLTVATHSIASTAIIYYLPVFFQACFGASPVRSAVDFLPGALLTAPFALVAGILVLVWQRYREINWIAWVFMVVAFGLTSTLKANASTAQWVGFQVVAAIGVGLNCSAPLFPILAPLKPERAGSALALFCFTRAFFQAWGIAIAGTILQNELHHHLPVAFVAQFPPHFEIAYAAIPSINALEEPLRSEVQAAFASSLAMIWKVMVGICGLGLLFSMLMKEVPMTMLKDDRFALEEQDDKVYNLENLNTVQPVPQVTDSPA
ncbi:unnamed protein product [Mycena citricolor]|uniref:Major facilitator superfamily (MFS) profile domain-containing protein n=1 Tax=Mycena citricolor TaxID=2018698 RepID=A0AAD2Q4N2_9AGAR|nr:unnamed protein product [Mycena citricolor]